MSRPCQFQDLSATSDEVKAKLAPVASRAEEIANRRAKKRKGQGGAPAPQPPEPDLSATAS
eukprot:6661374-Pyramimonas_sp.AAC.1